MKQFYSIQVLYVGTVHTINRCGILTSKEPTMTLNLVTHHMIIVMHYVRHRNIESTKQWFTCVLWIIVRLCTNKNFNSPSPTESIRTTRVAAHRLNLRVTHGRLDVRRNFFSVRVTGLWNDIPGHIKDQKTATGFKNAYAKFRKTIAQRG